MRAPSAIFGNLLHVAADNVIGRRCDWTQSVSWGVVASNRGSPTINQASSLDIIRVGNSQLRGPSLDGASKTAINIAQLFV